jgi:hypothetical protein
MIFQKFKFKDHKIEKSGILVPTDDGVVSVDGHRRVNDPEDTVGLVPSPKGDWIRASDLEDFGIINDLESFKFFLKQDLKNLKDLSEKSDEFLKWVDYDSKIGDLLASYESTIINNLMYMYYDQDDSKAESLITEFVYELEFGNNPETFKVGSTEYVVSDIDSFIDFFVASLELV